MDNDFYLVRRAQAKLALQSVYNDLMSYITRQSFQNVAKALTEKFWTRSIKQKRKIVDIVTELYLVWLVLLPIACRIQGYFRPGWGNSIFLSWFRYHVNKCRRYYMGKIDLIWDKPKLFFEELEIYDQPFKELCTDYLNFGKGETALPKFVRLIFSPFVFTSEIKQALTMAKTSNCGFMWDENHIIFLSTKPFEYNGLKWVDLRKESINTLKYNLSVKQNLLEVKVLGSFLKEIKLNIEGILKTDRTPGFKLMGINEQLQRFYHVAKYCGNSRKQSIELDKWAWKKIAKSLVATEPSLKDKYFSLRKQKWDLTFRIGRKSLFLDQDISDDLYISIWAPRR